MMRTIMIRRKLKSIGKLDEEFHLIPTTNNGIKVTEHPDYNIVDGMFEYFGNDVYYNFYKINNKWFSMFSMVGDGFIFNEDWMVKEEEFDESHFCDILNMFKELI